MLSQAFRGLSWKLATTTATRSWISSREALTSSRIHWKTLASEAVQNAVNDGEALRISSRCVERIQQLGKMRETPLSLRVKVDGGGCSGFQYAFELVEKGKEGPEDDVEDHVFEKDGVKVIVDDISLAYIRGAEIDYEVEMIRSAFRVADNPNSESSCGCGVSFTAKT